MCGIAGAIGPRARDLPRAVRRMSEAQIHRGPDSSGEFGATTEEAQVFFCFRRLAIIDLSSDGHQPMRDAKRGNVVAFNGELYNYAELRRELEQLGEQFVSKSDTEVLLKAYGQWGVDSLERMRGMFAFAIYDESQRTVLLARDRLGIKPLYYATVPHAEGATVVFASELRALLASDLVPRAIDPVGLASYAWNGFVVGPHTMVRGVHLMPAGYFARFSVDKPVIEPQRYWSLSESRTAPKDALAELDEALSTATRQHLVSDVPLGVFLSGGVDSSAVAALAVRAEGAKVQTFHIGFDEAGFDESGYARRVATALGTEHVEFRLTQQRFREGLDDALESLDQPTFDAINTYFVSRVVREAGFTVALAGTGGDELFGGYPSFRELPTAWKGARLLRGVPSRWLQHSGHLASRLMYGKPGEVPPQTRWAKLAALLATGGDPVRAYQVAYALYTPEFLEQLAPGHHEGTVAGLPTERWRELLDSGQGKTGPERISQLELSMFVGERLLRDSDAASMAVSLELRVPLLDHRVVEAVQAVPDEVRFNPLGKKRLLRQLALANVDPTIFDRPKAGFVLPIEVWAKDSLSGRIDELFGDETLVRSVGLDPRALGRLWRAFRSGAKGMYWSRVWSPLVLLTWCRRHQVSLA